MKHERIYPHDVDVEQFERSTLRMLLQWLQDDGVTAAWVVVAPDGYSRLAFVTPSGEGGADIMWAVRQAELEHWKR